MSTPQAPGEARWSLGRRIAFRWAFAYLVLYNLTALVERLPELSTLAERYDALWASFVPWVGARFLGVEISDLPSGSGDTMFHYVQVLLYVGVAVAVTLVWSVVDRRRSSYTALHAGLRVYVRYVLIVAMAVYGLSKVFKTQFPFPSLDRMMMPLGEASPMGLVWRFMGYSTGYNVFTGGAELLGAVLLCFRRTTTLGALVVLGVMSNVVALNFFYDIPVKLYSSHLLLMAGFLLLPDLRRLTDFLVLNRATSPVVLRTPFSSPGLEWGSRAVKVLFLGWCAYSLTAGELEAATKWGDQAPRSELEGIYKVEFFSWNGLELPPLATHATRWKRVIFAGQKGAQLQFMDDSVKRYLVSWRPKEQFFTMSYLDGAEVPLILDYTRLEDGALVLEGAVGNHSLRVLLARVDDSKLLLRDRGFHWINERPFHK